MAVMSISQVDSGVLEVREGKETLGDPVLWAAWRRATSSISSGHLRIYRTVVGFSDAEKNRENQWAYPQAARPEHGWMKDSFSLHIKPTNPSEQRPIKLLVELLGQKLRQVLLEKVWPVLQCGGVDAHVPSASRSQTWVHLRSRCSHRGDEPLLLNLCSALQLKVVQTEKAFSVTGVDHIDWTYWFILSSTVWLSEEKNKTFPFKWHYSRV